MKDLELTVADDYVPSEGELDNFVYLTCKYTIKWPMRQCDLKVCLLMAGERDGRIIKGNKGLTKLAEVTCEYLWDHVAGEPDEISADQLFDHIKPCLQNWYAKSTPEEREVTE